MTLDDVLKGLFPSGHQVKISDAGWITGAATRKTGGPISVIGVAKGVALGTAGVLPLAAQVLDVVARGGDTPILVLAACSSASSATADLPAGAAAVIFKDIDLEEQLGRALDASVA